jgi:hypothetical protein
LLATCLHFSGNCEVESCPSYQDKAADAQKPITHIQQLAFHFLAPCEDARVWSFNSREDRSK